MGPWYGRWHSFIAWERLIPGELNPYKTSAMNCSFLCSTCLLQMRYTCMLVQVSNSVVLQQEGEKVPMAKLLQNSPL